MNSNNNQDNDQITQKAAEIIRQKVAKIYQTSPNALEEQKISQIIPNDSPHQKFIKNLIATEKDVAIIQTKWHEYYMSLPDSEKFQVWQEFYDSNTIRSEKKNSHLDEQPSLVEHKNNVIDIRTNSFNSHQKKLRNTTPLKKQLIDQIENPHKKKKLSAKHHLKSLLFGLSFGFLALFIFMFSFFNQVIITPLIQPSAVASATPLILTGNNVAPTPNPEVIIPKINVQIPVNYTETSNSQAAIENDLESGVVHYPSTVFPGQIGNSAFFGHSSNNILNPGKYKFAFVLLHTLVNGDTFYLTRNNIIYVYKVISHQIVSPNDVGVLGPVPGQTATATLITCDPPGTSINRLVVVGQQISPNPANNTVSTASTAVYQTPTSLPGNGPSLFSRVFKSTTNKIIGIILLVLALGITIRWLYSFKD